MEGQAEIPDNFKEWTEEEAKILGIIEYNEVFARYS
jgi:hypothetical protein